jgi:hypothetical protein
MKIYSMNLSDDLSDDLSVNLSDEFVGQPAPGGGGTPALRAGGIHERSGEFRGIFCIGFEKYSVAHL